MIQYGYIKMERALQSLLSRFSILGRGLDGHRLELIVGASEAFLLKVIGGGLAFGFNLLLAKTVGAQGSGLYFLALTVASIASTLGQMGMGPTLLRFTAANAAVGDWPSVKGACAKGIKLVLIASTTMSIFLFLIAPTLAGFVFHKPELAGPIRWMSFSVVPTSLLTLSSNMLNGLKRIKGSIFISVVGVPLFSLILFFILAPAWGLRGAVAATLAASILVAGLGAILWRVAAPEWGKTPGFFPTGELLRSSLPIFGSVLPNMAVVWAPLLALGIWGTKEDVGIYGTASRACMLVNLFLFAANSISAPQFAALHRKGEMDSMDSIARYTSKLMFLMVSPLLILFLFLPGPIMGLFGGEFRAGAAILSILAVGQFVNVATGSVGVLLVMSGNERLLRNSAFFNAALCLILNSTLVPRGGAVGAAIASSISLAFGNLVCAYLVRSKLGINTIPFLSKGRFK